MLRTTTRSQELWTEAQELIPGGVNSPVRAFRAVGGNPVYIKSGFGSRVTDVDGNSYIDYLGSWGPLILGHAHPRVVEAVKKATADGLSFGACTELEVHMARLVQKFFPSLQKVRMVSSGTEATMSAIRVARGFTNRPGIIKFDGCYHGHADPLLAKAGSGAMTFDIPDSAGVLADVTRHTITLPYNNLDAVKDCLEAKGAEVAALIVEPVAGNMGVVPPRPGYLEGLRELTRKHGVLLIIDEVMTGFRVARGGAQQRYGVEPDLTTLGKIIGGGMPVGAYGGRRDVMDMVAPSGPIYQAGTLSGNPVAMACGLETLRTIDEDEGFYTRLEEKSAALTEGLARITRELKVEVQLQRVGSMMTMFFAASPVVDYVTARGSDTARYGDYFRRMLARGVYLAPSQFEAAFVSAAHTDADVEQTIEAAAASLREMLNT